jgi:hypothetical protein
MKKIAILSIIFLFLVALPVGAFPNDAKTVFIDAHSGISGDILTSVSYVRTILNVSSNCDSGKDAHILADGLLILDSEGVTLINKDVSTPLLANDDLTWTKPLTNDRCFFTVVYTDYNLASSTSGVYNDTYGTTTPTAMITNIENIGYVATTTITSSGESVTQGLYIIPFILFKFIFLLLLLTLSVIIILIFMKRKK